MKSFFFYFLSLSIVLTPSCKPKSPDRHIDPTDQTVTDVSSQQIDFLNLDDVNKETLSDVEHLVILLTPEELKNYNASELGALALTDDSDPAIGAGVSAGVGVLVLGGLSVWLHKKVSINEGVNVHPSLLKVPKPQSRGLVSSGLGSGPTFRQQMNSPETFRIEPIEPLHGTPLKNVKEASTTSSVNEATARALDVYKPGRAVLLEANSPDIARLRENPGFVLGTLPNGSVVGFPRFTKKTRLDLQNAPSLGQGAFGQTFKYTSKDGKEFAVTIPFPGKELVIDPDIKKLQATGLVPQYFGIVKVKHPSHGDQEVQGLVMEIGKDPFDIPSVVRNDERFWLRQADNMDALRTECIRLGVSDVDVTPDNFQLVGNDLKRTSFNRDAERVKQDREIETAKQYAHTLLNIRYGRKGIRFGGFDQNYPDLKAGPFKSRIGTMYYGH